MTVCDCHGSGDGDRGGMDDGDQGGTVVAQRTSGLYGEAGDGDHGGMVAAPPLCMLLVATTMLSPPLCMLLVAT